MSESKISVEKVLPQPNLDDINLATVLHALSDPVRLKIIYGLAVYGEQPCNSIELPVTNSTRTHHFRVLRKNGVIHTRRKGTMRLNQLRSEELEQRFPGLLEALLSELKRTEGQRG